SRRGARQGDVLNLNHVWRTKTMNTCGFHRSTLSHSADEEAGLLELVMAVLRWRAWAFSHLDNPNHHAERPPGKVETPEFEIVRRCLCCQNLPGVRALHQLGVGLGVEAGGERQAPTLGATHSELDLVRLAPELGGGHLRGMTPTSWNRRANGGEEDVKRRSA